jgi:hypothetical protein
MSIDVTPGCRRTCDSLSQTQAAQVMPSRISAASLFVFASHALGTTHEVPLHVGMVEQDEIGERSAAALRADSPASHHDAGSSRPRPLATMACATAWQPAHLAHIWRRCPPSDSRAR